MPFGTMKAGLLMERRLAAILAADVVGYSRLMNQDEAGALQALMAVRKDIIDPKIAEHKGRVFKATGDGVLAEFSSVVNAVACAADIQRVMSARNVDLPMDRAVQLRIGVNIGDVIVEGEDIFGDGVNVAVRLEGIAPPGGVVVSSTTRHHLGNRLNLQFEDMGERAFKNISDPIQVFCVRQDYAEPAHKVLPLPAKPSIAVLPFTNMSTDPEHEAFSDGLTEDLITDLSRNASLFVIARHSTFAYKGKTADVRQIARDLGVRFLLEGSARRAASRVRINVQLIDASDGSHMWAERFDRSLEDIFAVQDEVTSRIVEALVGRLTVQPQRNRPNNMEAYDLCVRGRALTGISPEASRESRLLLQRAIMLDPQYAQAHRFLAVNLWQGWVQWGEPAETNRLAAVATAEKAVMLDPNDAGCHLALGQLLAYERRWAESDKEFAAALEIDPNYADAWMILAENSVLRGQPDVAIERAEKAFRLNPRPPGFYYWDFGFAQYAARQYEAAVTTLRNAATYRTVSRRVLAASLAQMGLTEEARQEAALFMASNPHFTISRWAAAQPFRDDAIRAHFIEGYRKAGLPE